MRAYSARFAVLCLLAASSLPSISQQPAAARKIASFDHVSAAELLDNGVELRCGQMLLRITALRDDVLRIRASRSTTLPEDASWAVLPEARVASVAVMHESTPSAIAFHTRSLRVALQRTTGLLTVTDNSGNILRHDAEPLRFNANGSFRLTESMPREEHYFGLGDKPGPSDRRGRAFTMWNSDSYRFQESTDPLYKTIPFFLAVRNARATGTLLDNTWRSSFDFGKESDAAYSFGADNGACDFYVMSGTPRDVLEAYAWLTGKPPLPPRWMLGFQQSRYTYTPASRLLEVAERLRADRIPTDALYLDIDFQDRNRPFTVNKQTFPDLSALLSRLSALHFHTVAITDLHIAKAAGEDYAPFDSGTQIDAFLHRPDASVYSGKVWPGRAVFPEFTSQKVRQWWGNLYQPFVKLGFAGFWNDMNEPSIFDSPTGTIDTDVLHRIDEPGFTTRTATHAELHNVYGMENSRATYEGLLKLSPNTRPFVLTRATFAGGQRYAATWTGDNSSTWNHLRLTTPMLKSLGLSGFSFTGADVGGFAGSSTRDLLTKWLEIAAFQPIDRDHSEKGTSDQEPWIGGTASEDLRRHFINTRYQLMPYLYTLAEESARTGIPMERPLFLDYPNATRDGHPIDVDPNVDAEFLLGHDLLIAPSPYPEAPDAYTVEFPTAHWYDFWTGAAVAAPPKAAPVDPNAPPAASDMVPLSTNVTPSLNSLPVFVRGGAILPIAPLTQSTDETPEGPLTLRVFIGDDCHGEIYTDDGISFAYKHGEFLREQLTCSTQGNTLKLHILPRKGSFRPWWSALHIVVYGWHPTARQAILSAGSTTALSVVPNGVEFTVPDNGLGETVTLP